MNFQRFKAIVKKEIIQLKRDKASFGIAIMMPIIMTFLFGYAVNTQLEDISMTVLDQSNSIESRELVQSFQNTGYFKVVSHDKSMEEVREKMDKGTVHAAILIPPNFSNKLQDKEDINVELLVDGSDPTTARTAFSSGVISGQQYGVKKLQELGAKTNLKVQSNKVNVNTKVLYNPNLRNQNFTIPGLIGLIMQNITILLTAFALVRERERGTIEQLTVSPLKAGEIILGKLVPYIFIGYLDFLFSLVLGIKWFNVPINGSIPLLLVLGFAFVICALAIGILISTISKTQLQAMQLTILVLLPSILLSGFVFPREAMPKVIQIIGSVLPLTYFLNILRGIITKGVGAYYLVGDIFAMCLLAVILLTLSIVRFWAKPYNS
ncbi:ABC transporter permease [Clostridium felsineum]|uniref:ABC transporter permease n=1 Tax=Clostridium felsineum TaxID=36839 RepID=UPI00098C0019|nr:ABC transporter permease [Clostridium felsineum]URZ03297.1 putative multidrug ABC transporter permease YbhS [Clostridium felsineum]